MISSVMFKRKDFFYKKAKDEGYRSRAAYKLIEIQKNFKIFKPTDNVLDLGCAPGGWIQIVSQYVKGKIVGIDLLEVKPFKNKNIIILKGDIESTDIMSALPVKEFDVIISDMAPNTSGIKHADYYKSFELCKSAFKIAEKHLKKGGNFVVKIFQGNEFTQFYKELKKYFSSVKIFKPKSSRGTSAETYIVAKNFQR